MELVVEYYRVRSPRSPVDGWIKSIRPTFGTL
jgi:hypothetical protein